MNNTAEIQNQSLPDYKNYGIENFDSNGVAVLQNFIDRDLLNRVTQEWQAFSDSDLETQLTSDEPAVVFWRHVMGETKRIRPISGFPAIKELAYSKIFPELIKKIYTLGKKQCTEIRLLETIFFYKPPEKGGILRYHQDVAYFPFEPNNQVAVWIPLVPVDEANGTLKYVVGSHKLGNRRSINLHNGDSFDGDTRPLIPQDPETEGYTVLTSDLNPGDMTIHEGLTWHSSSPNITQNRPRLALSLRFLIGETRYSPNPGAAATFLKQLNISPGDKIESDAFPRVDM